MSRDDYDFAELAPDAVEEVRKTEQKLSERNGHPITLIAYMSESKPRENDPQ